MDVAHAVAAGKLDNDIDVVSSDEVGDLLKTMKVMQEGLNVVLQEVESCGLSMGQSSYQISSISNEIAKVNQQQQSRSGEVDGAMSQLDEISRQAFAQAVAAVERSNHVEDMARAGDRQCREQRRRDERDFGQSGAGVERNSGSAAVGTRDR
jgi:methyl-accepting chemotaxis protein